MKDYRVYLMGWDGHIRDRHEFFCADDDEAKERAKSLVDGHDVELWHATTKSRCFTMGIIRVIETNHLCRA